MHTISPLHYLYFIVKIKFRFVIFISVEPKYTDPVIGATASFQQRLMELSALEAETIRYERNKKVKKKVKQDRDS